MRRVPGLLVACLAIVPNVGCNRPPAPATAVAPAATPVKAVKPEQKAIRRVIEQPGSVQAFEETALFAKLPAFVGSISDDPEKMDRLPHDRQIDIGSRVKRDQVLVELSIPELEEEAKEKTALVTQAEAEVTQSEKALIASKAGVTSALAAVEEAKAGEGRALALYERWQSELARISGLVKSGVIDAQTRDETVNQFKSAEASRTEAAARIASSQAAVEKARADEAKAVADIAAVKAKLEVAKAEVRRLEALRSYTHITAPFDGIVTHRRANTRDFVGSAEKAPLFRVARLDPVRIVVNVPEADAGLVAPGQEVKITLPQSAGGEVIGKVTRMSWSLEPASRTLRTEIDLPNDKGNVRPGMYVYAKLTAEFPTGWAVPAATVAKVGEDFVVYLVENGKAIKATAQLGRGDTQSTQVRRYKKSGATDWTEVTGQEFFATPASGLSDGQAVK